MSILLDGTGGVTTPGVVNTAGETIATTLSVTGATNLGALTTTGNTILGDASTDTLNVGNGGLVKDASGNVGIGTASPTVKLDVNGSAYIRAGNILGLYNTDNTNQYQIYNGGSSGVNIGQLLFVQGGVAERMRIDSSGNLLVGATTPIDNSKLLVNQSGDKTCLAISGASTGGSSHIKNQSTQSSFTAMYMLTSTSTVAGGIYCSGSTTNYASGSDYRLKENIRPLQNGLALTLQMKPSEWEWKDAGNYGSGFIAHELQAVCPHAVTGEKDAVDEDGNIKPQGVDTSFLVGILTAAIQEQQALITQLQADVATLKALSA